MCVCLFLCAWSTSSTNEIKIEYKNFDWKRFAVVDFNKDHQHYLRNILLYIRNMGLFMNDRNPALLICWNGQRNCHVFFCWRKKNVLSFTLNSACVDCMPLDYNIMYKITHILLIKINQKAHIAEIYMWRAHDVCGKCLCFRHLSKQNELKYRRKKQRQPEIRKKIVE